VKAKAFFPFLMLMALSTATPLLAHGRAQSSSSSGPMAAKIKCQGGDWVNVTVDSEQALPLQVVDKAACGEDATVLSDPQGYTVKIRTASGKIGYVTRYEVAVDPNAPVKLAPIIIVHGGSNRAPAQAPALAATPPVSSSLPAAPAPEDKGPHKPRVYISDSQSWEETGGFGNAVGANGEKLYAGYNPDMVDVYQNFTSDCSAVTVVQDKTNAEYAILFDKGSSKKGVKGLGGLVKVNKVTVVNRSGETIISEESHSADTAVKTACEAVAQKSSVVTSSPSAH
jgi:hypothetical protein